MFGIHFYRPFIVIGMHRSGTSFVAKLLHESGIFMGAERDHNEESIPFLSVNQRALATCGGSWIDPVIPEREHWTTEKDIGLYVNHFALDVGRYRFAGRDRPTLIKWFHDKPWGFKDPRSTLTLAMWLNMFPRARVIHVVRNSDAVIRSLIRRNNREGEVHDPRIDDPDFCRSLWEKYLHAADIHLMTLPKDQYLEIRYEDLMNHPEAVHSLGQFVGKDLLRAHKAWVIRKE